MINEEITVTDDDYLTPPVREYVAPVLLGVLCLLLGVAVWLIWGLDWRVFWTPCVVALGVVLVTAAMDHRRREHARIEREEAAFRKALQGTPMGRLLQPSGLRIGQGAAICSKCGRTIDPLLTANYPPDGQPSHGTCPGDLPGDAA